MFLSWLNSLVLYSTIETHWGICCGQKSLESQWPLSSLPSMPFTTLPNSNAVILTLGGRLPLVLPEGQISVLAALPDRGSSLGPQHKAPSPDGHDGRSSGSQEGRYFENGKTSGRSYGRWNGGKKSYTNLIILVYIGPSFRNSTTNIQPPCTS